MGPKRVFYYCIGLGVLFSLTQLLYPLFGSSEAEFDGAPFESDSEEAVHLQYVSTERSFFGYYVNASGKFLQRVEKFNTALSKVRGYILEENSRRKGVDRKFNQTDPWDDFVLKAKSKFIWGARDNYFRELATYHRHIITVVLPWVKSGTHRAVLTASVDGERWDYSTDEWNYLQQSYYQWTGNDRLCKWIENGMKNRFQYDAILNRSCIRDITGSAVKPHPVQPLFFYNKLFIKNLYWPNNGSAYPENFYTTPPQSVLYVHIHQDAVVNNIGDVFSGNTSLAMYNCRNWGEAPTSSLPQDARKAPLHEEVFTVCQSWATSIYHRAIEVVPRLAPYIDFLNENPQIRIHAAEKGGGLLGKMMETLGLDPSRLITGTQRAKILYQPRDAGCEMASVQEVQILALLYRQYITKNLSPARRRNRLVFVQRTKLRKFLQQRAVEAAMERVAKDYQLTYTLFAENKLPSFRNTMALFNEAVIIVGPHGAGMLNMIFSEPGTSVVEGVCNIPHLNLCFQRLAHVLGHRYHGIASNEGCMKFIDVPAEAIEAAVRKHLDV